MNSIRLKRLKPIKEKQAFELGIKEKLIQLKRVLFLSPRFNRQRLKWNHDMLKLKGKLIVYKNILVFSLIMVGIVGALFGVLYFQSLIPDLYVSSKAYIPMTIPEMPTQEEIQEANLVIQEQRNSLRSYEEISGKAINAGHLSFAIL